MIYECVKPDDWTLEHWNFQIRWVLEYPAIPAEQGYEVGQRDIDGRYCFYVRCSDEGWQKHMHEVGQ